jgi:acyl transferase domain-containing protein/SAM-dependent methyltransferase
MTDGPKAAEALSPVKRALVEIRALRARLAEAEAGFREPIAIIGMGLRLPGGVHDAISFSRLLWSGDDAVTGIPPERWPLDDLYADDPDRPGTMTTRHGAFLTDIDRFDADFFGISPREAASMDPQQRLVLEVGWEALEDAGRAPLGLSGSSTGVYLGVANSDYGRALFACPDLIDAYFSTGSAYSVAAGRLSYHLGLRGPSIALDTACSSSLVAVHLACQALRLHECDLALAGGVNLILTPEMNINFSKARMMASDGRCKTFDAAADGYVRGEGCALLALRRLSDALADGDDIRAVVRGTAIGQDGRSGGLTAPNGPAQEDVIRAALSNAGLPASAVGFVETHGTGTSLGDPIEAHALGSVFGEDRERPLVIGSVKTNLGHLEAAAGVAGLVKAVLSLQRGEIPPNLHFKQGNPHIDWTLPLTVPTRVVPFVPIDGRRIAGVSSFGFSGTNAHIVLEEAPAVPAPIKITDRPLHVLAVSARDDDSLRDLAQRHADRLSADAGIADVCFSANTGRSHFASRLAVVVDTGDALREAASAYAQSRPASNVAVGRGDGVRPRVAFLFTGQGSQYPGMGRALYATSPIFREALDACAAGLEPHLGCWLLDVLFADDPGPLDATSLAQPAIFAVETALAALWRSWGIEPDAVLGHSLGEYSAAYVAGMLSLDDALRLVAERGRLTQEILTTALTGAGGMAAVRCPQAVIDAELAKSGGDLEIAAFNGPEHVVIAGGVETVEKAAGRLQAIGLEVKRLRVSYGAHSRSVVPVLEPFGRVLETVAFAPPRLTLVSNVSGAAAGPGEMTRPEYWQAQMRQPVRFAQGMRTLAAQGITHFVEIGPHPVLLGLGAECLPDSPSLAWLPSLRRGRADWTDLTESLQRLYVDGAPVDWRGFDRGYPRRRVSLPTYPFCRRRHWMDVVGTQAETGFQWPDVTDALDRQAAQGPLDLNAASYPAKWASLARVVSACTIQILREAGLFRVAGERRTVDAVMADAQIGKSHRPLIRRWLDRLTTDGVLRAEGEAYVADRPLPDPDRSGAWREAETQLSDNVQLFAYVKHCDSLLGDVLTGRTSPLETLFPAGRFELAEDLYVRSGTMRYVNAIAAAAAQVISRGTLPRRRMRWLEIGAGTGSTTAALLPVLRHDRVRYRFTDVSDVFLDRARRRFADFPFVEYGKFDLDRELSGQGYTPASFDVVVSANAVHACADLRGVLRQLRELLSPGGILILIESTTYFAWFDITTALIETWDRSIDDLRVDVPLLSAPSWVTVLEECGFSAAGAWPRPGTPGDLLGQHVIVARAPGTLVGASAGPEEAPPVVAGAEGEPPDPEDGMHRTILEALPAHRGDLLRTFVRDLVMQVLRRDADDPPAGNARLMELGFDSLMAVQLRNHLGTGLGLDRPLPATLMFDYPTIDTIASYLNERLSPREEPAEASAPSSREAAAAGLSVLDAETVAAMSDEEIELLLLDRLERR